MKSFKEHLVTDRHNHPDFLKSYACYMAYVGRQAHRGDRVAQNFVGDIQKFEQEYVEHLVSTTTSTARTSASQIINNSVEVYTTAEFKELHQSIRWSCGHIDVLAKFNDFAALQGCHEYSLSKDMIADVTLSGEFEAALEDDVFEAVLEGVLELEQAEGIDAVLTEVFSPMNKTFKDMHKSVRRMDHSNDLVHYVSKVFTGLPCLTRFGRRVRYDRPCALRFEVAVNGSTKRLNSGRDPFIERQAQGHQADAVVQTADGLQLAIVESARLSRTAEEKVAQDHYKLARAMRDTWLQLLRELVADNRKPPATLTVFGVQAFGTEIAFVAMDFRGCFRLYELARVRIPNSAKAMEKNLAQYLSTCLGFARLVSATRDGFNALEAVNMKARRTYDRAIAKIKVTTCTPTKSTKMNKRKLVD
ncbi:hypothetical protein BGZ94_004064 [Podila epigama]|nr:hypothetical protein BGZ94_004064 [Podila epigama]